LRTHGTASLCVGFSFTQNKFNDEKTRPQNLCINDGVLTDDDDDGDDRMFEKSNIFHVGENIRFLSKSTRECYVENFDEEKKEEQEKKKKKTRSAIKDQEEKPSVKKERAMLSDRPSNDVSSNDESSDDGNTNNLSSKRGRTRKSPRRHKGV